jgi:hypothetical protein
MSIVNVESVACHMFLSMLFIDDGKMISTHLIKELNSLSQHVRIGATPVFCFPLLVFVGSNEYMA